MSIRYACALVLFASFFPAAQAAITAPVAKSATYTVNHKPNVTKQYAVDIAKLNGFKFQTGVTWNFLGQTGTAGTVFKGTGTYADKMYIRVGGTATGTVTANYNVVMDTRSAQGTITFNVTCNNCTSSALTAQNTSISAAHEYNRQVTYTIDVKTISGVGSDSTVNVTILGTSGTLNGGVAAVVNNRINYTTGLTQGSNQDININYQLTRGTETSSATVFVDVTCLPDCITPTGQNLTTTVLVPISGVVPATFNLAIQGGTIAITSAPNRGAATSTSNTITYTPYSPAVDGTDVIRYRVNKLSNGVVLASSVEYIINITIDAATSCTGYCDGRPTTTNLSFNPPTLNTDGTAILEGQITNYTVYMKKQDSSESQILTDLPHTGSLLDRQTATLTIDYSAFSNSELMSGVCFHVTATNSSGTQSNASNTTCRTW